MWEILKWILIVNGAFLLVYAFVVFATRDKYDDDDWGVSKKKRRRH